MKFEIETRALQRAIKVLGIVVHANAPDATGRILIELQEDEATLTGNNGSTDVVLTVPVTDVEGEGAVAIAYGEIKSFVSSFRPFDGTHGVKGLKFITDERNVRIIAQNVLSDGKKARSVLKASSFNPASFQKPRTFEDVTFIMNSTVFRSALDRVLYSVNPDLSLSIPAIQGMHISFDEDSICFVGSDARVLSEYQIPNNSDNKDGSVTLKYDFIMGLRRLLIDDIQLFWEIKSDRIFVKFEDVVFSGGYIIGHEYPDYKSSFDNYTDHVNFSREFLRQAISPILDVLDPDDNYRITFEIKDKIVRIYSAQGEMSAEQNIQGGLDYSIDLNGVLFAQTIEAIKDDNIVFKFSDEDGLIIFESSTRNDHKALILPLSKH
jgi:DNA polymerase III sliding clamp (beta) subunit (PCNA family)